MPTLSIIIPCYYNEENIPVTTQRLLENESSFPGDVAFEYIFIDDGSKDKTYLKLQEFYEAYSYKVKVVKLVANVGSYNAILAGMTYATGDCCVVLAADLQDPPELIVKMYSYWEKGNKLVIANRQKREDPFFQSLFSNLTHFLTRKFALKNFPAGGFDLVLFDKKLCKEIVAIDERNTNTLSLLLWLGYDYITIPYTRKKRDIGKSRWTLSKKVKLFIDSFVAFSFFPIRLITSIGLLLGFLSFLYGLFLIIARITGIINVQGWTSIMVVVLFISSFQMIALGIIGEYVWRSLDASRKRPNFIVDRVLHHKSEGVSTY
jgi:polyisoprenyl-phosphate glycosyltransferase